MIRHHPQAIVLGLGCNLGPRRTTLELAYRLLERAGVRIADHSRLYWTRPWGFTPQPPFINAALALRARWRPLELLWRCQWVERELGRRRHGPSWGPRRIDIDLLLFGNLQRNDDRLQLPHPRIPQRDFVLRPLLDLQVPPIPRIAPHGWAALLARLRPEQRTIIQTQPWRPNR